MSGPETLLHLAARDGALSVTTTPDGSVTRLVLVLRHLEQGVTAELEVDDVKALRDTLDDWLTDDAAIDADGVPA